MDQQNGRYAVKNAHVFVPVVLCAVTTLIFQIKRIISSEKWFNYVVTFFFFLKMLKIWVGQTTLNGEKKEDGLTLTKERRLVNRVRFESSMTPGSLAEVTGTRS